MSEFASIIAAFAALGTFALSITVYLSSKRHEKEINKLILALSAATLVSGGTAGEPTLAIRLFNEQLPLLKENLKL